MQQKESKTTWHFNMSMAKSILRIAAGIGLMCMSDSYLNAVGGLLVGAEFLGILEEL